MNSSVVVSVIVLAHDREKYLLGALKSIESSKLIDSSVEVIVVKNFKNEIVDSFISESKYKNIITHSVQISEKIRIGLRSCNGKIITFLEDDDEYLPDRLMILVDTFKKYPNLAYYHNSFVMVDENNNRYYDHIRRSFSHNILLSHSEFGVDLEYIIKHNGHHNLSSIAIDESIKEKFLKLAPVITSTPDTLMLLLSIEFGMNLFFDIRRLTKWRVHNSITNNSSDLQGFVMSKTSAFTKYYQDFYHMMRTFSMDTITIYLYTSMLKFDTMLKLLGKHNLRNTDFFSDLERSKTKVKKLTLLQIKIVELLSRIAPRLSLIIYYNLRKIS